jgi:uncharacterized protein (AIM24 family)
VTGASTGGGIKKGLVHKTRSGETLFANEMHGRGEICLGSTLGHFLLHHVSGEESGVIADKSLF